jgi:hypothetical protein
MSRIHAHRMIDAAQVAENLLPTGNIPATERQLRPLASLEPEDQRTVWEQAVEENDDRKDFTQSERGRTFKAALQTVADVERVAAVLSDSDKTKPKPRGHKPKHGVARKEIAEAMGTSETSLIAAEQHAETATEFPFMQGDK